MQNLSITELSKSFGSKIIALNLKLQLNSGDIIGIFGRNGSGKSTILKMLFGTLRADSLKLELNGSVIRVEDIIPKNIIGYLPQENFLPARLKVRDIIPLYFKGDLQDKLFYADGIPKIANTVAGKLSMGELRYFELLLVGNLNHPFLLLDEPFSMVEPLYKEKIKEFLTKLKDTKGIIVTDHYYKDVLAISNKNYLLKDGKLLNIIGEAELISEGYLPTPKI
jgi:ABC-type lipopolysaccharide export system ATPase subunit